MMTMANEHHKMATALQNMTAEQLRVTDRLEAITARQDSFSAFQENLGTIKYKNTGMKLGTPEIFVDLDALLGSSADAARGPSLGLKWKEGGVLPLGPGPGVGREYLNPPSEHHRRIFIEQMDPDYRWALPPS